MKSGRDDTCYVTLSVGLALPPHCIHTMYGGLNACRCDLYNAVRLRFRLKNIKVVIALNDSIFNMSDFLDL